MVSTTMIAVVTNEGGLRDGGLPQPRREGAEVVAVGHRRQAGEEVAPGGGWVFAAALVRKKDRGVGKRPGGIYLKGLGEGA
jgi:hypothetical protein